MSRIREIETLVAEWKIGDAVFAYGEGYTVPVMEGRVFDLRLRNAALGVSEKDVGNFAAMAFGQRNGEGVWGEV